MTGEVRVRYAPSPTGIPHVGNIRTALFNWLFARHSGGKFVVRIEDTDQARKVPGATEAILESLKWLGMDWDEGPTEDSRANKGPLGPYFQSQRLDIYETHTRKLLDEDHAYHCYCTPERLDEMRKEQAARKEPPRYDRRCRNLTGAERREMEAKGTPKVVRFKTPVDGETRVEDLIRGEVVFDNAGLDDFVLVKSDKFPTYHMANVVDDHLMQISHVMRADEWLPSTPRHKLLYSALGWKPPIWAHLPLILGPDRSKLSKRHGATSLLEYRDQGYLPEAMMNFLALLGWSLDDKTEIISREELIKHFDLDRIGKTGAIFDKEKLSWMNGMYIRQLRDDRLAERMAPLLESDLPKGVRRPIDRAYLAKITPLVKDRLRTLKDSAELTMFFFEDELKYDPVLLVQKGMDPSSTLKALQSALNRVEGLNGFDHPTLEGALRPLAEELGMKTGQLFGAIRVAVTGRTASPPLFETMAVLGRERCLERLKRALRALG